jgi:hypothetical protein
VLVSTSALYAHFFAALVICAQAASLLWLPKQQIRWSRIIPAWAVIALGAVPISFYVLKRDVGQLYWVQPTTLSEVYKLAVFFAGGSKAVAAVLSVLSVAAIVVAIAANTKMLQTRTEASWRFMIALLWAVVPVGSTILASLHRPLFVHRYLLVVLPAYLMLIGMGLARLQKRTYLAAALILFISLSSVSIAQGYFRPVEDWRSAVDYVLSSSQPEDSVLIYIPYGANNFHFYVARRERLGLRTKLARIDGVQSLSQAETIDSPRTWLLLYPSPHTAEEAPRLEGALKARYAGLERKRFKGIEVLLFTQLTRPPSRPPTASAPRR